MFNRRAFLVHWIQADKEEAGDQGVGVTIRPNLTCDVKNKKVCHQAKCDPIFDIYTSKIPWAVLCDYRLIQEVHLNYEGVPMENEIWSLGTPPENNKSESANIKE